MLVLGLLLILLASALTVGAVYDGSESATVELLGWSLDTTIAGVFFTGAGTALLLLLGVWLLTASMERARRRRSERKQTRARQRESVSQLEQERNELRAENERLSQQVSAADRTSDDGAAETSRPVEQRRSRGLSGSELESPISTGGHAAHGGTTTTTDEGQLPARG